MERSDRQERNNQQQTRGAATGAALGAPGGRHKDGDNGVDREESVWSRLKSKAVNAFRRQLEQARAEAARYENLEIYGAGIIRLKEDFLTSEDWKRRAEAVQKHIERRKGEGPAQSVRAHPVSQVRPAETLRTGRSAGPK